MMSGGKGQARGVSAVLTVLMVTATLFSALPSCSAASPASTPAKKPKTSSPPPPPPSPPSVDIVSRRSSSVVFPIHGDVYPHGIYYVEMSIGEPPKPYFLDVDTGSDLTWLQCDAPCVSCLKAPHPLYRPVKNKLVPCKDPLCVKLHSSDLKERGCESLRQCDYEIEYADRATSAGVLVTDALSLRLTNGSLVRSQLAFGCGFDQQNFGVSMDGMLGLGNGKSSIISQLHDQGLTRNVIGHCLSSKRGGYLFFGDDIVPSSGMTWAPMSRSAFSKHYSPGPANLLLGKQSLGVKELNVIFDSGSSYSYLTSRAYQTFLSMVKKDLTGKPLKEAPEDPTLPLCWKGRKPFKSVQDVKKYFKTLILSFVNTKMAQLEIPPEGYLIISKYGNACLGILNGTEVGLRDLNLIGDISMQDLMVVYDNEKQQIGWVRANCDRLPNADGDGGFEEGFYQPHFNGMGILTEEFPAAHSSSTV